MTFLESACTYLGDIVSPLRCAACDAFLQQRALFCPTCATSIIRWQRGGQPIAFGHYGGALATALLRLKYANRPDIARSLGQLLRSVVVQHLAKDQVDVLIPVPVPYDRLVQRGYNQAALLAQSLRVCFSAVWEPRALGRRKGSIKQAALNRQERWENLKNAFYLRRPQRIDGQRILLVDDISTTGATLDCCRHLLQSHGAKTVYTTVVARTESPDNPS